MIICQCLPHLLTREPLFKEPVTVYLNEGDAFTLKINFTSDTRYPHHHFEIGLKISWYHTYEYLSVSDPKNQMYITNLISSQVVACKSEICSNTVNLGYAHVTDSGEYVVKLSNVDDYEYVTEQTQYIVFVYSRISLPLIEVRNHETNFVKINQVQLNYDDVCRFTCSSLLVPHPSIKMSWSPQCIDGNFQVEDVMNISKIAVGTFETVLYFETTPLFEGLLTCTVNDKWTSELFKSY